MEERLQKLLSQYGVASRRTAETYIQAGRVTVNGRVAGIGDRADPERDRVALDGVPLRAPQSRTYLMLNKPAGYVTTLSDEKGRPTVAGLVAGCGARVWPVGRLDLNSEGLLIMTDDGELTHALLHPSYEVEKEYLVWVRGEVKEALPGLSSPMTLDGQLVQAVSVRKLTGGEDFALLSIIIHEGKNRQIRRMCAASGLTVERLRRVREGPLSLGGLAPGKWRALTAKEVAQLRRLKDG